MARHDERAALASGRPPQTSVLLGGELSEHSPKSRQSQRRSPDQAAPRWRSNTTGETAQAAALAMSSRAPTLRQLVLAIISEGPAIPETILARLRTDGVRTVLTSIRPRCSELVRMGLIRDSGRREKGEGGCNAIVWRLATPEEQQQFAQHAAEKGVGR